MTRISACRACGHANLLPVLDLGSMPLANALLPPSGSIESEPRFPLELVHCPSCSLIQITETIPPEQLFGDYVYFSSYSRTMLDHAQRLAELLIDRFHLTKDSLVIEAASNDGYLLQYFVERGVPVLGVEPAANVAEVARKVRNVPTRTEFFGADLSRRLRSEGKQADVVIGINVLAHVPDLNGFVEGIRTVLKPGGAAVIEVPSAMDLFAHAEFDTIYHEHLFYFSLKALRALFSRHGLRIIDVERLRIHGGSLRIYAVSDGAASVSGRVEEELSAEEGSEDFSSFAARVKAVRTEIPAFLKSRRNAGRRVAAYGAAAKGAVLMNYCGLGTDLVEFVVDRNPAKQGKRMPGTHQPIYDPAELLARRPDDLLILPWNIADEIVNQERVFASAGGKFIVPAPEIREIG